MIDEPHLSRSLKSRSLEKDRIRIPTGVGRENYGSDELSAGSNLYHLMTQGKIRYNCSMKNQILLENYHPPGQLEARLAAVVDYYNSPALPR